MEKKIADKIESLISAKSTDDTQISNFIKASEEYQKLIEDGLTAKRGFNLMTTEEIYTPNLEYKYSQSIHQ